ncbi:MAG TPA: 4-hydroxy-tetrahydrodipicolinate reductase [Aliidongia sp.]|nr:4-hydroxy-tetrahydrodipicolinate reductase [Aliidongia sp.]
MVRIGIVGCGGQMGRMLIAEVADTKGAELAGGTDIAESLQGRDLGEMVGLSRCGSVVGREPAALFAASDVVIDFTIPKVSVAIAELAAQMGKALVIGTTGMDPAQSQAIAAAAERAPILWAPNMSLGVNLLLGLVEQVARTLGPDFDIEILEMHHRRKIDAPSGTALGLGQAAARGRAVALEAAAIRSRDGQTGARPAGAIGFATLRGGDVVGEHTVFFAGQGERLELTHRATDRRLFARGAVKAALWLAGRGPGLYGMKDVLGL